MTTFDKQLICFFCLVHIGCRNRDMIFREYCQKWVFNVVFIAPIFWCVGFSNILFSASVISLSYPQDQPRPSTVFVYHIRTATQVFGFVFLRLLYLFGWEGGKGGGGIGLE